MEGKLLDLVLIVEGAPEGSVFDVVLWRVHEGVESPPPHPFKQLPVSIASVSLPPLKVTHERRKNSEAKGKKGGREGQKRQKGKVFIF